MIAALQSSLSAKDMELEVRHFFCQQWIKGKLHLLESLFSTVGHH